MGASVLTHSIEENYVAIRRFACEHEGITYLQLDDYITKEINLFALPEQELFASMEQRLNHIIAALPALKRIFSKPITRLKDVHNVLPVEAVHIINHATVQYLSLHTEFWENVSQEGIKPRKLMTLSHEEQYKTYENMVFTRLIDLILAYVRQSTHLLQDVTHSCHPLRFDLAERTHHLMHPLAVSKLHVGYANVNDRYHLAHGRCMEKLRFIDKALRSKLRAPVYRICHSDQTKLTLRRTNAFRLQKDYRQVYALSKLFAEGDKIQTPPADSLPAKAYADYCTLLSLFAARHFNFQFEEKEVLCFDALHTSCFFKNWVLTMQRIKLDNIEALRFTVKKEGQHSVCLILRSRASITSAALQFFKTAYPTDDILFAESACKSDTGSSVYLSLFDIDSFLRIQQLILRCMVYADHIHDCCPFCGTSPMLTDDGYECSWCKTWIRLCICPKTQKNYFTVTIKNLHPHHDDSNAPAMPIGKYANQTADSIFFYHNITALSHSHQPICPHCGKTHR